MRDIRADLRERLEVFQRERAQLETHIAVLDQKITITKAALQQENDRINSEQETIPFAENKPLGGAGSGPYSTPLAHSVFAAFKRENPASLEFLKAQAMKDQIPFGGKNPGRTIHFLLVGMQQNGIVERTPDGEWHLLHEIEAAS
jgi:hypothetical protein